MYTYTYHIYIYTYIYIYINIYKYTHYMITLIQCVMYLLAVDLTRQSGAKTSGSDINNIGQNNLKTIGCIFIDHY